MAIPSLSFHAPLLDCDGHLPIVARFSHCLHLARTDGHVVTVTTERTDGPLTCGVPASRRMQFAHVTSVRFDSETAPVVAESQPVAVISLDRSRAWDPAVEPLPWEPTIVATGIRTLYAHTWKAAFFRTDAMGKMLMRARIEALKAITSADTGCFADTAIRLAGLGAGLTPSGGDWLVGVAIALKRLSSSAAQQPAQHVGEAIMAPAVLASTTRLSRTLLWFAAQGVASTDMLDLVRGLFYGERDLEQRIDRVIGAGHTSGSDMALGVADGMRLGLSWSSQA